MGKTVRFFSFLLQEQMVCDIVLFIGQATARLRQWKRWFPSSEVVSGNQDTANAHFLRNGRLLLPEPLGFSRGSSQFTKSLFVHESG